MKHKQKKHDQRPTIGFLTHEIWGTFGSLFWSGIINATEEQDANLICFPGGNLRPAQKNPANVVYDLASAHNVDGLVISASSLSSFMELEDFRAFCEHFRPLPIVNLAATLEGIPAALVDNYQGMRDVLTHLVDAHSCRRIAFIPGPQGNAEGEERYRAYTDTLNDYDIPFDPDLVAPPGDWNPSSGRHAIHVLLDQRGKQFDAVVAANDRMAAGVLEALQARGLSVPDDVIVTGFDDSEEAWFLTPPLTTARQPMREQFRQATKMVLAQIRGERVPEQVIVPTELVVRQSCGCLDSSVMQATAIPITTTESTLEETLIARRDDILREMTHVIANRAVHLPVGWASHLLDKFAVGMKKKSVDDFLLTLDRTLHQATASGSNVADWREVLAVMRRYTSPHLDQEELLWAEYLCQKANVIIGEAARRIDMRQAWQKMEQARLLGNIEADLITAFDVKRLTDVLTERLPTLDIPSCYLSLYEGPAVPGNWARLILAYKEQERVTLEADGLRFPSRHLMPERFWPRERRYHFVVEPLYFQDQQLGFAVFEARSRDGDVYEMLRRGLSSALQGTLLVQRVQERSAELTRQQYILDTFMESVPDRIYFKDLESRITRANKAHAAKMGLDDPSEEIGKSDFDFFPEERARAKYELEQEIIRTGQPVLSLEETDGAGHWVLTTKMPLRDERGNIIGTFGISHDITEMKQAQAELVRQERLLALGQLTATVAHEIRNPLGTVRTCVFAIGDAIEQGELGRVERALKLAERNIVRCDTIIGELLDYTRDWMLQRSPTKIDDWLNGVLDELLDLGNIPENITCVRELNASAEIAIDTEHLRRAVINVINNAVDAMQEKGLGDEGNRLAVSTRVIGERLEIRVSDTGDGIPAEMMDKLFEPLFSTKSFGVGLGLPIVKGIMEQHGGGVEISSLANEGTTVVLWLPMLNSL
ncbi:MAG: substrate-binding domain-containing protein [Anaerolineae bacterium]|nr:substrate-binding domain-containing protein [Anaerolineae bacterium]